MNKFTRRLFSNKVEDREVAYVDKQGCKQKTLDDQEAHIPIIQAAYDACCPAGRPRKFMGRDILMPPLIARRMT